MTTRTLTLPQEQLLPAWRAAVLAYRRTLRATREDRMAWPAAYSALREVVPAMPEAQAKQETTHAIAFAAANHTAWFWRTCGRGPSQGDPQGRLAGSASSAAYLGGYAAFTPVPQRRWRKRSRGQNRALSASRPTRTITSMMPITCQTESKMSCRSAPCRNEVLYHFGNEKRFCPHPKAWHMGQQTIRARYRRPAGSQP